MRSDHGFRVPAAGHQIQQDPFHVQDLPELRPAKILGTPEVPGGQLEPPGLAALVGGLEEADGFEVQDPLVVGRAPLRLGQGLLGPAVRIAGVVERGELQPGLRVVGKARRHLLQNAPHPGLDVPAPPQQVEQEAVALAVAGVGFEARRHQVDEDHPGEHPGGVDLPARQLGQRLHHPGRQKLGLDCTMTDTGQGLQHATTGQRVVLGAGQLDSQSIEEGDGRRRIPQIERRLLEQQPDPGRHPRHPIGRHEAPHQAVDGLDAEPAPKRREAGDLQEIGAGLKGRLGTEGVREVGDQPFQDARAFVPTQGFAERVAEPLHRRARGSEGLSHPHRAPLAFAVAETPPLGDRMGEDEVGGQQLQGAVQSLVVPGTEAHHGLAEHAPRRERGASGHGLQELGGPPPVSRVHGVDASHDRRRVPPQGMARIECVEAAPAPPDHEQVRQHPFDPGGSRPGGQGVRIDRRRIGPVQIADAEDQVLVPQRLYGDGGPVPGGLGTHRSGLLFETAARQLPGALDAGAEAEERELLRAAVLVRHLPEPVESAAPVPASEEPAHLLQQIGGGNVPRLRPFPSSLSAAALAGCHACVVRESLGGSVVLGHCARFRHRVRPVREATVRQTADRILRQPLHAPIRTTSIVLLLI